MGQAFMDIGDVCSELAGPHSLVGYVRAVIEFSMQQQDRLFHFQNACLDYSMNYSNY